jgi:putative ABC transport system ATP-binding protein
MLEVRGLEKRYGAGAPLLAGVVLSVARGEWCAIVGESGSGKSTLLHIVAGLDRPDAGEVAVDGKPLDFADDEALALWRRRAVGFVFQAFHLLPYLSVGGNVALPLALLGVPSSEREARVREALAAVGLAGFGDRRPGTLSGGEMQRAAIARALVHRPALVLADEPTGNLDEDNAKAVLACLGDAVKRAGAAALMVTHSPVAAARADRVLRLAHGRLEPAR